MKNILKTILIVAITLQISIFTYSCKAAKNSTLATNDSISVVEGTWVLDEFEGKPASESFKGKIPFMVLDFTENKISGNSGCNSYFGSFVLDNNTLKTSSIASTLMLCMEDNKEKEFLQIFENPKEIIVVDSKLSMMDNSKKVASFVKGLDMKSLASQKWVLKSINGKDATSLFTNGNIPSLEIKPSENKVTGNSGCNSFNSNYNIQGTTIEISPAMMTRMACPNMDAESLFINEIVGSSTLKVADGSLIFIKKGKDVLIFVPQSSQK